MVEVTVRRATEKDTGDILNLYSEMHSLSPYRELEIDIPSAQRWINAHLKSEKGIVYVGETKGEVVGFIMGILHSFPAGPKNTMAVETGWFVKENSRSTRLGALLLRKFEQIATQKGANVISIGRLAEKEMPVDKKSGTNGYHPVEVYHLKKVG